jgi:hypothetical protein
MDYFTTALTRIRSLLGFAPDWAVAAALVVFAVITALAVHRIAVAVLTRVLGGRHPMIERIISGTRRPARWALVVCAVAMTLPAAPLADAVALRLSHLLILITIGLLGWIAIAAIHIAADIYLMRFRIDVADNLLARKHYTQIRILVRVADILVVSICTRVLPVWRSIPISSAPLPLHSTEMPTQEKAFSTK